MINDMFINVQELENELKNMQQIGEILNIKFSLLSQQINYIFSKIETCKILEDADEYFELLDKIQEGLACLLYKYKIGMSDRLLRFVHDFDNLEQVYKEYYFKKIILGEYSF
jgi:hypothetical protein